MALESKLIPVLPLKKNNKAISSNINSIILGSLAGVNAVAPGDLATFATLLPKIDNLAVETDTLHPLRLAKGTVFCDIDLTDKPKEFEFPGGQMGAAGDSGYTAKITTWDMAWWDFVNRVLEGETTRVYGWLLSDSHLFGKKSKAALDFSVSISSHKGNGKDGTFMAEIHLKFKGVYRYFDAPTGFAEYEMPV